MAILDNGIEELAAGQQIVFAHTANNVVGVLAVACGSSDTTISLSPGGGALFPNAPFYCSIEFEVLWCLSKSGDNLIVQRGQDGTLAQTHSVGVSVEMRNNAGLWTDAYNAINSVSTDVGTLQTNILNKTALPPDTTFQDNLQSLTHKTIDLTDSAKQNFIIGNVSPDPAQLIYQNILNNGGFEEWFTNITTTLAAGTPTSGARSAIFSNYWTMLGKNDSSITCARDTSNVDPGNPSGVACLINVTTVQAGDVSEIQNNPFEFNVNDTLKLVGAPVSVSARARALSGNIQLRFIYYYQTSPGVWTSFTSPWTTVPTSYSTIKFENQVWIPNNAAGSNPSVFGVQFQGVGQIALDNVMMIVGSVATNYRPRPSAPAPRTNIVNNESMDSWLRGSPISITAEGQYHADRWQCVRGGTGSTVTIQAGGSDKGSGSMAVTVSGGTVNASNPITIYQNLIVSNTGEILDIRGLPFSVTMRCTANQPNALSVAFLAVPNSYESRFHSGNTQWEILKATGLVGISANNVQVRFNIYAPGSYNIDYLIGDVGWVPPEYTPPHPTTTALKMSRYYQQLATYPNVGWIFMYLQFQAGNGLAGVQNYRGVGMGGIPTFTLSPVSTWYVNNANTNIQPTALAVWFSTPNYVALNGNLGVTGTVGSMCTLAPQTAAESMVAEWNPT